MPRFNSRSLPRHVLHQPSIRGSQWRSLNWMREAWGAPSPDKLPRTLYASGEGHGVGRSWTRRRARSGCCSGAVPLAPIPGQQFVNTLGRIDRQARQHIGEPSLRIDIVKLGGGDQRVDGGCAPAAFVGAREGRVAAPNRDRTQLAFGISDISTRSDPVHFRPVISSPLRSSRIGIEDTKVRRRTCFLSDPTWRLPIAGAFWQSFSHRHKCG